MVQLFANNAQSTLALPAAISDLTLTLVDGSKFPSPTGGDYFLLTLATGSPESAWEVCKVTGRAGNVLTVQRAQESTTAQAWAAGSPAELRLTAGLMSRFEASSGRTLAASDFGITGTGDETVAFLDAIAAVAAVGTNRLILDVPTLTLTTGTDCAGVNLIGAPTAISGTIQNVGSASSGLVIAGQHQDRRAFHPQPLGTGNTPKLIAQLDANNLLAIVPLSTKGYVSIKFNNNSTTTTESLAATATDATPWRVIGVRKVVDVYVAYQTTSGSSGTWSSPLTLNVGGEEPMDNTDPLKYTRSSTSGGYLEYTITPRLDGQFNVGILSTATSSTDVTVSVDGVAIDSNFTTVNAAGSALMIRTYRVQTSSKPIVVRITNNTSAYMNVIGCNFSKLKNHDCESQYSAYGYYERSSVYKNAISRAVANDYAIREYNSGKYGGSYHGGETSIVSTLLIGGEAVSIPGSAALLGISRSIVLKQSCVLSWASVGGGSLNVDTLTTLSDGGYSLKCTFSGSVVVSHFYSTLYGVTEGFPIISAPVLVDLTGTGTSDQDVPFGQQNHVEYRTAATNQFVQITHTVFTGGDDQHFGGAYVKKVYGTYHKYYYAPIESGHRVVTNLSSVTQFLFG